MRSEEEKIKEERTVEAMKKDYMGRGGKLGAILLAFGEPIYSHGSTYHDETYLDDPWVVEKTPDSPDWTIEDLPEFGEDEISSAVGYVFDGLRMGMHLEIRYVDFVLSVTWKGRPVYVEESGDLQCFFPNAAWESKVEYLYERARNQKLELKKQRKQMIRERNNTEKQSWLKHLWETWGFKL